MGDQVNSTKTDSDNVHHSGTHRFLASKFVVVDDTDSTKQAKFICSGITSGAVSEITIPDIDYTALTPTVQAAVSNKTLQDSTVFFVGSSDATKKVAFECDGLTTATTRTWTFPDSDGTFASTTGTSLLTNKTLDDATCGFVDDGDNTKVLKFQCSGITTATTRTITIQDSDDVLVGRDTTDTLTNKTMTAPTLNNCAVLSVDADNLTVTDNTDQTKIFALLCSGITTATTRTWTVPDSNDTFVGKATTDVFTNKSLSDSTCSFVDEGDNTKALKFQLSGLTTATTRTLTIQDSDDVLVGRDTTDILTNKTLTTPTLNNCAVLSVDDNNFTVTDDGDQTKIFALQCSGITTSTTRTWTVPDADDTFCGIGASQTLTNKELTSPVLTAGATDAAIGAVAAPPSGTTAVTIERVGNFFQLTFTLTAAQIAVTDAGGSGSHGSTKIFDFVDGGVSYLGCRQDYTAYSPDGTGVPNDAVFEIGIGTTAISAAADGVLGATEDDIGGDVNQTLSGGTTTGTEFTGAGTVVDGTGTATDLNLNWSGTAATIDGNGTIDVTGTITVIGCIIGND